MPTTETIAVTYDPASPEPFSFATNGQPIPNGDLTMYTGQNQLTFTPATGQTWSFLSFSIGLSARVGRNAKSSQVGTNAQGQGDSFAIETSPREVFVTDNVMVKSGQTRTYEYAFVIELQDGLTVTCDPKMYNQT